MNTTPAHRPQLRFCSRILCATMLLSASCFSHGDEPETDLGLSLSADYEHQQFDASDGDIYSLRLTPYVVVGDWLLAADLTYQRLEGTTAVYRGAVFDALCQSLSSTGTLPRRVLQRVRNPQLFINRLNANCGATRETTESGLADITVFANYARPLATENPWLGANWLGSITGGYVADNGDAEQGLGTGTQDTYLEAAVSGDFSKLSTRMLLGYNTIIGGEWESYFDDYAYGSFELSTPASARWVAGANWYMQQSDFEGGDDVKKITLFGEWHSDNALSLRIYYSDYAADPIYPEASAGANIYFHF